MKGSGWKGRYVLERAAERAKGGERTEGLELRLQQGGEEKWEEEREWAGSGLIVYTREEVDGNT